MKLDGGLFAESGEQGKPSPLSLVDTPKPGDRIVKLTDVRATGRPQDDSGDRIRATAGKFGRPQDNQLKTDRDRSSEADWPSRLLIRRGGRYNPDLIEKVDDALDKQRVIWQDFVNWSMALWLWLGCPPLKTDSGDRSPAMLWCSGCSSDQFIKTTTTTSKKAVARKLPGFPQKLLEMSNKSRHTPTVLWEYALSSIRGDIPGFEGLNRPPEFWVKKCMSEPNEIWESMVDRWLEAKRKLEDEAARRLAAQDEHEAAERALGVQARARFEERERERVKGKQEEKDGKRRWEE